MAATSQPRLYLAILAGGASQRACRGDGSAPKQFRDAGGRMLFMHSLQELAQAPNVVHAIVAVPEAWRPLVEESVRAAGFHIPCTPAPAGLHRTASAWQTLQALAALPEAQQPRSDDLIAIHDAARPFASRHLLARLAQVAVRHGAAVPGVAVTDTIIRLTGGDPGDLLTAEKAETTYLERASLAAVQTPQVARWDRLYEAHAWAASTGASFTDDGGLLCARGLSPAVVMGEAGNWKITTEEDWQRAEAELRRVSGG